MSGKRACSFIVADKNMELTVRGFLGRARFHESLGCSLFDFDPVEDLLVARGASDPGLYTRAEAFASGAFSSHERLVMMLDADWKGSPGAEQIEADLLAAFARAGWEAEMVCPVVIAPELENWIWQDKPIVAETLGHRGRDSLRHVLEAKQLWPADRSKPPRPKEALEAVLRANRVPRSSALYERIAQRVSIKGCTDPAFQKLVATLRRWFPTEEPTSFTE